MNTQKVVISGIAGGIVFFLLGWLIYGILLKDVMAGHAGSSPVAMKTDKEMMSGMNMLYLIAGNMASGFLLAIIFGRWANINTLMGGLMGGAVIGFFQSGSMDCIMFATTNTMSRSGVAIDVLAFTVLSAVGGAVVALVLGMGKKA